MTTSLDCSAAKAFWVLWVAVLLTGCPDPFDTDHASTDSLTLGAEIYHEVCNRVARAEDPNELTGLKYRGACRKGEELPADATPRLFALAAERSRFISAVDDSLVDPIPSDINQLLRAIIPLYDDEGLQAQTRALATLIERVEDSPEALAALNRLGAREGYRPLDLTTGLARPLLAYERINEVVDALLAAVGDEGAAREQWREVLSALHLSLKHAAPAEENPLHPSNGELIRNLALSQNEIFGDGASRFLVRRDDRGVAQVQGESAAQWPGDFADTNLDGLPDTGVDGGYIDADGAPVMVAAPFALAGENNATPRDDHARLLTGDGNLVFEYLDTSETLLAGGLQEARLIWEHNPAALIDLIHPMSNLLGPVESVSETFEDGSTAVFTGFHTADSPILDATHALASFADKPAFYFDLRLAEELLEHRETEIARLLKGFLSIQEWLSESPYTEIELLPGTPLGDEILDFLEDLARSPGLLEDFLAALDDPRAKSLPGIMAGYMRYTDRVDVHVDADGDINGLPVTQSPDGNNFSFDYAGAVDRSQADNEDNRSIFQRFVHLTADVHRAPFCNKAGAKLHLGPLTYPLWGDGYAECELFEIEDMASFYVKTIVGTSEMVFKDGLVDALSNLDFMLESTSGVDGFTKNPTPAAVNRVMFAESNDFLAALFDPPRSLDGAVLKERHPGTIFAWEQPGFYEGVAPIAEVLDAHNRTDLFGELLHLLNRHWYSQDSNVVQSSNPSGPLYVHATGLVQFEELAARALTEADILNVAGELVTAASDLPVDAYTGRDVIMDTIRQLVLPEWNEGLVTRGGDATISRADGQLHPNVTPARLLVDALRNVDDAFAMDPQGQENFSDALRVVTDVVLPVVEDGGGSSFENRRALAGVKILTAFGRERVGAHWDANDITAWALELPVDVEDLIGDPLFYSVVNLLNRLVSMPDTRAELEEALGYLIGQVSPNEAFSTTLVSLADVIQFSVDDANVLPLLHALAPAFEPDTGLVDATLGFIADANTLDNTRVTTRLLERLVAMRPPAGETAFEALIDIAGEVNRMTPGQGGRWSVADYSAVLKIVREYLLDEDYGVERLYQLIENR